MDATQIIQQFANLLWIANPLDEDGNECDAMEFKAVLQHHFPDLAFTYSAQTKEWLLLTEIFTI